MLLEKNGKVFIVGAGTGDPDLLTIKAAKTIGIGDIIITDRLVNSEIINLYKNKKAQVIYAGKKGRCKDSISNEQIQKWMVTFALEGKNIIRLKGGDISIYAQLKEEIETLIKNNIIFELIPGITTASAVAAYANIPLTAKGFSNSVRIMSLHLPDFEINKEMATALLNETWVLYMSANNINEIIKQINKHIFSNEIFVNIIENVSMQKQTELSFNINEYNKYDLTNIKSPSIILIGKLMKFQKIYKNYIIEKQNLQLTELLN